MPTDDSGGKPRKVIDWDLIEKDWRAGVKTKAQMSEEHGPSRAAMDKHFRKRGIKRDLGDKIRAESAARVAQAIAKDANQSGNSERDIVDANAAVQTQIILSHRRDIQRSRRLHMTLLEELELQTNKIELLQEFGEIMYAPDDKGNDKRAELYAKVISLASRATTMKVLMDCQRGLVAMERQAFGLDDKKEEETNTGIDDVIARVKAKHGGN